MVTGIPCRASSRAASAPKTPYPPKTMTRTAGCYHTVVVRHLRQFRYLVRLDVKQQLSSAWFYLILIGNLALPPSWYLTYPDKESIKVLMVDDLGNRNYLDIEQAIAKEGFQVRRWPTLEGAMDELVFWRATAVVHVDAGGTIHWWAASPRLRKLFSRAVRASLLGEINDSLDQQASRQGQERYEIPLVARNFFEGLERKEVSMATFLVRTTWYFGGLVTLITFIMMRVYLSKLKRLYSTSLILLSKVVAGTILGSTLMVLFVGWLWLAGITIPHYPSYLFDFLLVLVHGVTYGCALGAIPLAISRDPLGLVFGALMAISLSFMGMGQLSAFLNPISNMHPMVYWIDIFNPLYNSNQVIHNCTFLGDPITSPTNLAYLWRIGIEAIVLLVVARIALGRA